MCDKSKEILDTLIKLIQVGDPFSIIPQWISPKLDSKINNEIIGKITTINLKSIEVEVKNTTYVIPKKYINCNDSHLFCEITSHIHTKRANGKIYLINYNE